MNKGFSISDPVFTNSTIFRHSKKKRRWQKKCVTSLSNAVRPQLLVLVTQGLQDFFALVLGNFPAALFSQISHDQSFFFGSVILEHSEMYHIFPFFQVPFRFFSEFCLFFSSAGGLPADQDPEIRTFTIDRQVFAVVS